MGSIDPLRLDPAESANTIECARARAAVVPGVEFAIESFAMGYLVFAGRHTSLTSVVGIDRCARLSLQELRRAEDFFRSRGAPPIIHLSSRAPQSLAAQLTRAGYAVKEVMTVQALNLEPAAAEAARGPVDEIAGNEPKQHWASTVSAGFGEADVGETIAAMREVRLFLARDADGEPLGGAAMAQRNGVWMFFGDSTIPRQRGRGIQTRLIHHRLRVARDTGGVACALTVPGSQSQLNYERAGFRFSHNRIAYWLPASSTRRTTSST